MRENQKRLRVVEIDGKRKTLSVTEEELQNFMNENNNAVLIR